MEKKPRKQGGFAAQRMSIDVAKNHIEKAYELEKSAGESLNRSDEHKQQAARYLNQFDIKHLDVDLLDVTVRLQMTTRTTVRYDLERLKKRLEPKVLKEVIKKKYTVSDIDTLKSVMRQYGVPAEVLKACLEVTETVDNSRMDDLFQSGLFTVDELKGTFTLSENTSLRLREIASK